MPLWLLKDGTAASAAAAASAAHCLLLPLLLASPRAPLPTCPATLLLTRRALPALPPAPLPGLQGGSIDLDALAAASAAKIQQRGAIGGREPPQQRAPQGNILLNFVDAVGGFLRRLQGGGPRQ